MVIWEELLRSVVSGILDGRTVVSEVMDIRLSEERVPGGLSALTG